MDFGNKSTARPRSRAISGTSVLLSSNRNAFQDILRFFKRCGSTEHNICAEIAVYDHLCFLRGSSLACNQSTSKISRLVHNQISKCVFLCPPQYSKQAKYAV
eukprot:816495-Pleurochrysis_carterae.AAC.1